MAYALVAVFGGAALWRVLLATQEYLAAARIVDDPSARELAEASALVECALAVMLLAHAAGAFVYTRQQLAFNWVAVSSVALVSSLSLMSALGGLIGGLYPVVLVGAIATLGYRFPRAWASFYLGGLGGCIVAWVAIVPDHDPFVGLFVVVPSLVYVLIGALLGSWIPGKPSLQ